MIRPQLGLKIHPGKIVVIFAGLGGMCHAIERALGRPVDVACNHNPHALAVHRVNHPQTKHYICDVYELDPVVACEGDWVEILHLSPDCTDHSQAAAGQPRDIVSRSLSWVMLMWIGRLKKKFGRGPRIITFENVKQIENWGPTIAKRCKETGRVIKIDGTVAAPGERVPVQLQWLVNDPRRKGKRWRRLLSIAAVQGYHHAAGSMVAANYGTPTSRDRLFMVTRCDDLPAVIPAPTYSKAGKNPLKKWRSAAECIDWRIPVPSIFSRKRPLVEATCKRIARGVMELVINHPDPYFVDRGTFMGGGGVAPFRYDAAHGEGKPGKDERRGKGAHDLREPFGSPAATNSFGLAVPMVTPICQTNGGNRTTPASDPFPTMTAKTKGGHLALTAAFMAQHNGGNWADNPGHDLRKPFSTFTGRATQQQLVTAHVTHLRNNCQDQDLRDPLSTITASGNHHGLVSTRLSPMLTPDEEAGALRVAAFLMRYYSSGGQLGDIRMPMPTATTKDRIALVTVWIQGYPRTICDIGMRMFAARELANGMGFLPSFILDRGIFELPDGSTEVRAITSTMQKELIGNAVAIQPAEALIRANAADLIVFGKGEREAIA